jgi:hypothetical protein
MKGSMGHFGETPLILQQPISLDQAAAQQQLSLFSTTSSLASKSLSNTFEKAEMVAKSKEIQEFIKANNLEPYLKDVNKDGMIKILALLGMWQGVKIVKSKPGLIGLGLFGLYFLYSRTVNNPEKISEKAATLAVKDSPPQTVVLPSSVKV